MEFMEVVRRRRSIRKYRPDPVPEELITSVLEAARLAPSWANTQCWKFVVVTDHETRRALAQAGNKWIADVPVIIVACADPSLPGIKGDQHYYMLDIGIAMEHLVLAAADQGLGTCWIGAFDENAVRRALGVPPNIRVVAETPLGYPDEDPPPKPRKSLEEIACMERYR
ncbi:nitroreductase [candidate division KD3-62 bacterium DG_56]|uniref:Nitroreductase n=1 Tax=candidate division KD3-62 bacterium DG_56 TaxID=1704032 RepID=A0A0S7XKL8_9BACT|nr:MAG: nitroreductase [candidate division KD3-62 bacterium DG_56]